MTVAGYFAVLRRRYLVLVLCIAAGVAGALFQVHRTPRMYVATATYFVTLPSGSGSNPDASQTAVSVVESFLDSFQQLAVKRSTADAVATSLGVPIDQVAGHLGSSVETNTFYIDVSATSGDPNMARVLADGAAQVITQLIPKIQATSANPARATVSDRATVPGRPYQPTPRKTVTLGALTGLVLGIALMGLIEALDRTTRSSAQAAQLAGAPLLGVIPRRKQPDLVLRDAQREPYRSLRAAVTFLNPDDPPRTFMVTSPVPADGKTSTAANLAVTLAEAGSQVLLIDADLRRRSLSRYYRVRKAPGLSGVITRDSTLEEVLLKEGELFLLPAGAPPPNPSELLGSQAAVSLLEDIRNRFDVVVIDAPPVLVVSDALALAPHVDAVLLVVRHGKTPRSAVQESRRRLHSLGIDISGVIDNAVPRREVSGYYGDYIYVED